MKKKKLILMGHQTKNKEQNTEDREQKTDEETIKINVVPVNMMEKGKEIIFKIKTMLNGRQI